MAASTPRRDGRVPRPEHGQVGEVGTFRRCAPAASRVGPGQQPRPSGQRAGRAILGGPPHPSRLADTVADRPSRCDRPRGRHRSRAGAAPVGEQRHEGDSSDGGPPRKMPRTARDGGRPSQVLRHPRSLRLCVRDREGRRRGAEQTRRYALPIRHDRLRGPLCRCRVPTHPVPLEPALTPNRSPGCRVGECTAGKRVRLCASASLGARCGRGSAGRAQPCQGWGRGFESRRPLSADRCALLPPVVPTP